MKNKNNIPYIYLAFISIVLVVWFYYIHENAYGYLIVKESKVILTMLFGAFVAGSSPEGSAAIAYPIFTLGLKINPSDTRNFAFAIQSIGMTATSIFILNKRITIDKSYIFYVSIIGAIGLYVGTLHIAPLVSPKLAKICFVSLWLSFGFVLWFINLDKNRITFDQLGTLNKFDIVLILVFGFLGGIISSIFGTGINIFTFCLMVVYFRLSEKVATPSSVIIMTIETIIGFALHKYLMHDFSDTSKEMWLACIPFVIFMAPLGAFVASKIHRVQLGNFLSFILVIQFFGAYLVIKPNLNLTILSMTILWLGIFLFVLLNKYHKPLKKY